MENQLQQLGFRRENPPFVLGRVQTLLLTLLTGREKKVSLTVLYAILYIIVMKKVAGHLSFGDWRDGPVDKALFCKQ